MICTDPPYNVAIEGCTKDKLTIKNDKMESDVFLEFLTKALRNMATYLKEGGPFYVWYAFRTTLEFMQACEQLGRRCAMMEYDPKYADVIIERWQNLTGEDAELIEGES